MLYMMLRAGVCVALHLQAPFKGAASPSVTGNDMRTLLVGFDAKPNAYDEHISRMSKTLKTALALAACFCCSCQAGKQNMADLTACAV